MSQQQVPSSVPDNESVPQGSTEPSSPSVSTIVEAKPSPYPAGESIHTTVVDGVERKFLVYKPAIVDDPRAVVFVLHGGGGEGLGVATSGRHPLGVFRTVADKEGFIVVYPEGLPSRDRQSNVGWVDCRGDNSVAGGADDLSFLTALVAKFGEAYRLPRARMFMAGSSNGAQMAQAFALFRPDLLGAIASSAGSLPQTPLPGACSAGPAQPLPVLLVHGTSDTQMPYGGGCVADLAGACNRGRVISAEATRDWWLAVNGVTGVVPVETVIENDSSDGGAAHRFVYGNPATVEWWRLDGAGHAAPSRSALVATNRLTGVQNRDLEFAEVAWRFFETHLPRD